MTNDTAAPLRHPARRFYGSAMQGMLSALLWNKDRIEDPTFTGRRVLGFKLPDFQRGERWSDDQCIAFLESLWMGVSPGAYMVNWSYTNDHNHYLLLDGQQRLRALERYWNGELAVPGEDGHAYRWTELTEAEHNHFLRIPFPWLETRYTTDAQLREAYNRHNFGGTPHRPDERA
ncbi:DUF262 domain-containing protein [Cupriavidus pampae]|uniref:GmrSD restriction endonucleases N-terminal domain-containing protein n=1 Tax=Cupriavidus pampae TaxID=659251 RepID=A0ABM8XTR1_9BURK|nr:DUF262 domain-containing protein [Cupriavidus pampae]CAG9183741.1 hypothetical protein LMG32289_05406 [Cupriavidus pampae]